MLYDPVHVLEKKRFSMKNKSKKNPVHILEKERFLWTRLRLRAAWEYLNNLDSLEVESPEGREWLGYEASGNTEVS